MTDLDGIGYECGMSEVSTASPAHLIGERLLAVGVARMTGQRLHLDPKTTPHPVVVGRVCDDSPLFHSETALGRTAPDRLIRGLGAAAILCGAQRMLLGFDESDPDLRRLLEREARGTRVELCPVQPRYPMDPASLLCDLSAPRGSVNAAGLDRALVLEAQELYDLALALEGRAPLRRMVTVAGAVKRPTVLHVPLGTPFQDLVETCGGLDDPGFQVVVNGLPGGRLADADETVDWDTRGLLVLGHRHPQVVRSRTPAIDELRRLHSVCCNCRLCTDACTAYLCGADLEPHRIMAILGTSVGQPMSGLGAEVLGALSCRGCGVCSTLCPSGLRPAELVSQVAVDLGLRGLRRPEAPPLRLHPDRPGRRQSVARLVTRLGLGAADPYRPQAPRTFIPRTLTLMARSPSGSPRLPVVSVGDRVARNDLLALCPAGSTELDCRAPTAGAILAVDTDDGITLAPS